MMSHEVGMELRRTPGITQYPFSQRKSRISLPSSGESTIPSSPLPSIDAGSGKLRRWLRSVALKLSPARETVALVCAWDVLRCLDQMASLERNALGRVYYGAK
eukprot:COSAG04_NODE_2238_length_4470_cov_4.215969_2_plen_103_part_00